MKKIKQMNKYMIGLLVFALLLGGCTKPGPVIDQPSGSNADIETNVGQKDPKTEDAQVEKAGITYPFTIKDSFDREIILKQELKRIVSISPSVTEMIFAVGAGDRLVGRTKHCDYPLEVTDIESIGTITEPSIEKIIELQPDLIFASAHFQKESLEQLEAVGIPVVMLYDGKNFEEVYEMIMTVGEVTDNKDEAEKIVQGMKDKIQAITDKVKGEDQPTVYYIVGFGEYGDYTAGGDTFIGKIIEMAGGVNAAKDAEGWSYSLEKLVEQDPDILVCSQYFDMKAGIEAANGYKDLTAVKEGRLHEIDNNLLDRQGPRLAEGLEALAKILHPELFQ